MQMINTFWLELLECWSQIKEFYGKTKVLRWISAGLLFVLYGIRFAEGEYFIDSELMLTVPETLLQSWYGHRRFALIFTRKLFSMLRFMPFMENALLLLVFFATGFTALFAIWYWSGKSEKLNAGHGLFLLFFFSSPCFVEQFNFSMQAFEIALVMSICVGAAFCLGKFIYEGKSVLWGIIGFGMMVWSFDTYQSFFAFYMGIVLISYICEFFYDKDRCGWREGILQAILFIVGYGFSQLLAVWMCQLKSGNSDYVNGMIRWGIDSIQDCLIGIRIDYNRIYCGEWPTFFDSKMFVGSVAVSAVLSLWKKIHKKQVVCFEIAWFFLLLTPILTTLLTAMAQPIRSHFAFPLVAAFTVYFSYEVMMNVTEKKKWFQHLACGVVFVIGIMTGWRQSVTVGQLWETAHGTYQADRALAQRIYDRVCMVADMQDMRECQVIFVGARGAEISSNAVMGDVIGHSFFQWDSQSMSTLNHRLNGYFRALGLPMYYLKADNEVDELNKEAAEAAENHTVWPTADSVFRLKDGQVVVKLSEPLK